MVGIVLSCLVVGGIALIVIKCFKKKGVELKEVNDVSNAQQSDID